MKDNKKLSNIIIIRTPFTFMHDQYHMIRLLKKNDEVILSSKYHHHAVEKLKETLTSEGFRPCVEVDRRIDKEGILYITIRKIGPVA